MDYYKKLKSSDFFCIPLMIVTIILSQYTQAQDNLKLGSMAKNVKFHRAWVKTMEGKKHKGFLLEADSTFITLVKHPRRHSNVRWTLPIGNIDMLKIRRKGRVLRGAGIGFLVGAFSGFMIGYLDGDDPPCDKPGWGCLLYVQSTAEEKGFMGAVLLSLPGAITGAIIGSGRKKYQLHGKIETYKQHTSTIRTYSIYGQIENLLPVE